MDKITAIVIVMGILALVVVAFFAVFRSKGKAKIKGPWGMGVDVEDSNQPPGVKIKSAQAGGSIHVESTGPGGVDLNRVKADGDITATNSPGGGQPPPKAKPPTR